MKPKIALVFGTRPEAIKMAPVVLQLKMTEAFDTSVIVTAQHREMLDQVLRHFGIRPQHDLDIMTPAQSLTDIAVRALKGLDGLFDDLRPDLVLVHGDTSTTFIGSLAAFYHRIAVGHVEAGLRTGNKYSPFPEEMNRRMTAVLADLHFAPTSIPRANLLAEGIPDERIFVTGNTAIDALLWTVRDDFELGLPLPPGGKKLVLVDVHRRENFGEPMEQILEAVRTVAARKDVVVYFSVHPNPNVKEPAGRLLGREERVVLFEPLDYPEWANLMARAHLIISDSGGIQEEAPSLGVPVLLTRETTERPEALEAGTVRLVGSHRERIVGEVFMLLDDPEHYRAMSRARNPYGDGRAAVRIVDALRYRFGLTDTRPESFQ